MEGAGRPVRRSGPFYTLAYFYYTTIYHLVPLLASVWVPAACGSGGLVGMVNTNLEKMPAETRQQVLPGQRLLGAMADDRATTLSYPLN
jgi:hypothetical protein